MQRSLIIPGETTMMFNCPGTFEKALSNPKDWIYLSHDNLPLHVL